MDQWLESDIPENLVVCDMPRSLNKVYIHAVWTTKNREALLASSLRQPLHEHFLLVAESNKFKILIVNSMGDHVHCLFQLPLTMTIAGILKALKGSSSNWIYQNELVDGTFHWQEGYAAYSVSPQHVERVKAYIYNQEKHHANQTVGEELRMLEKKSGELQVSASRERGVNRPPR